MKTLKKSNITPYFIVGDVHGCLEELRLLISKAKSQLVFDQVILLGDLINKGPMSFEVLEYVKTNNFISIIGNHELSFLRKIQENKKLSSLLKELLEKIEQSPIDWITWLEKLPRFIETDQFICVHAGLQPNLKIDQQKDDVITNIRTWDGKGTDFQNEKNPSWHSFYKSSKPIIFGHWAKQGLLQKDNIFGLDTGCVYGKKLTGIHMPSKKIIQIDALKKYRKLS